MSEPLGKFVSNWKKCGIACRKCKEHDGVEYRNWESDCGGFEDTSYACRKCGHIWWVDGPDA